MMTIALRACALLLLATSMLNAAPTAKVRPAERPGWIGLGLQYDPGTGGKPGSLYVRTVGM